MELNRGVHSEQEGVFYRNYIKTNNLPCSHCFSQKMCVNRVKTGVKTMQASEILEHFAELGITFSTDGTHVRLSGPTDLVTESFYESIIIHKSEIITLLLQGDEGKNSKLTLELPAETSRKIQDVSFPVVPSEPPSYIARCKHCGGTNWGCVKIEPETLPNGEVVESETWACMDCYQATVSTCPRCGSINVVIDQGGEYCVDCKARAVELPRRSTPKPVEIGIKWSPGEKGYLRLTNPITGEVADVLAKGQPEKWLFDRLNGVEKKIELPDIEEID